jgi:CheY-like chemotaxis protein
MDAILSADSSESNRRLLMALFQELLDAVDGPEASGPADPKTSSDCVAAKASGSLGGEKTGARGPKSPHGRKHRSKGQATILVVEDREIDREMLTILLGHAGYRVLEAADGPQALELIRSTHPDLVISDVLLPKMDGYQLVRELRADPAVSGTNVIFYTAVFNEREACDLAREIGVVRILSKPMEPEKILESVAEVLKSQRDQPASPPPAGFEEKHLQLLINKLIDRIKALQRSEEHLQKKSQILVGINRVFHEALTCDSEEELAHTVLEVAKGLTGSKVAFMGKVNQARKLDITH